MSYIGQQLPADTFQGFVTDSFTGDGSATTFTLSKEPFSEDTLIVVINNVIQKPTTNFTVSGTTLTIVGDAVASGDVIYAIHMGGPLPIGGASELDLNGASDKLILDLDGDTTISADTDDQIDFKAGGTDTMHIINGKVGIGTSSPAKHLSLKTDGGGAAVGIDIHNQGTDNADDALITFETQGHRNFSLGIDRSESNFVIMSEADGLGTPRITVDDDGKVGIGTSSPSTNLHIFSTADNAPHLLLENFQNADTDDAAVLEFYLNDETTGGISDDTDVGVIRFTGDEKDGGTKETYAEIRGVAHDPGQNTSNKGNLSFFVQSAGSLTETMTLDENNAVFNNKINVGASITTRGSVSPKTAPIDNAVFAASMGMMSEDDRDPKPGDFPTGQYSNFSAYAGTGGGSPYADVMILDTFGHSSGGNANAIFVSKTDPNDIKIAQQTTQSTSTFVSGTVTDIDTTSSSDASVKENVQNITGALDKIAQLRPVTFEWTDEYINNGLSKNDEEKRYTDGELATFYTDDDELPEGKKVGDVKTEGSASTRIIPDTKVTNVGLIAQEVEAVIPTVVHQRRVSLAGTNNYLKNIDYDKLVPHLIGAVKELKAKVEALEDA